MQDFLNFISSFLGIVVDFLMAEPIKYFTYSFILIMVIAILREIICIARKN